jgi:hypothetical protein
MAHIWSAWQDIAQAGPTRENYPGIYQIRIVDKAGNPVPIHRVASTDGDGIIYIGSGDANTRINDFRRTLNFKAHHNGGSTYLLMQMNFKHIGHAYENCKPQYRVTHLPNVRKAKLENQEAVILADYFNKYCELPPCNSSFPNKWGQFTERLKQLWGWDTKP